MAYGSDQGLAEYATATGRTFTGDRTIARQVASNYINGSAFWDRWIGAPVDKYGDAWPRNGIDGIANTVIPDRVLKAVYEAAIIWSGDSEALSSGAVSNNGSGAVAQEKVDVISISYHAPKDDDHLAEDTVIDNTPRYSEIEDLLTPFLSRTFGASASAFVV